MYDKVRELLKKEEELGRKIRSKQAHYNSLSEVEDEETIYEESFTIHGEFVTLGDIEDVVNEFKGCLSEEGYNTNLLVSRNRLVELDTDDLEIEIIYENVKDWEGYPITEATVIIRGNIIISEEEQEKERKVIEDKISLLEQELSEVTKQLEELGVKSD